MVIVSKKGGKFRVGGNYRNLNVLAKFIAKPMSNTKKVFTHLANSRHYTTLDLKKGMDGKPRCR